MENKSERIYVDPLMKFYIDRETKALAEELKRKHGLNQIDIPMIKGSQWLANKLLNNKALISYRVIKTGLNKGRIEFL